jgi:hypothetical protein
MQDGDEDEGGRSTTTSLKDRLMEGVLVVGILMCVGILAAMLRMMLVHILSGLLFMGVAAYTVLRGQEARTGLHRLLWFVSTGLVIFLFSYWALQVVFRPPRMKETIGCGGVRFVDENGNEVDMNAPVEGEGPGQLRTEL